MAPPQGAPPPPLYRFSASTYDASWVAKLPFEAFRHQVLRDLAEQYHAPHHADSVVPPLLLAILEDLARTQHEDGSWGSIAYSVGDRLVCTLATIAALATNRRRWPETQSFPLPLQQAMQRGIDWLERHGRAAASGYNPENDRADLVGSELTIAALRRELHDHGIDLITLSAKEEKRAAILTTHPQIADPVTRRAHQKLQSIPPAWLFEPGSAITHSLEFAGGLLPIDAHRLLDAVSPLGSVGNSPAATAFVLARTWTFLDEERRSQMLTYLVRAAGSVETDGSANVAPRWPNNFPLQSFLDIWHAYYLGSIQAGHGGVPPSIAALLEPNATAPQQYGHAGWGSGDAFSIDADTTATGLVIATPLLAKGAQRAIIWELLDSLLAYYQPQRGYFRTYQHELGASLTTNAHAYHALTTILDAVKDGLAPPHATLVRRLEDAAGATAMFIVDARHPDGWWADKWHMSPLYATFHAVASGALQHANLGPHDYRRILDWLLSQQDEEGGWGEPANADETVHALLLLRELLLRFARASAQARPAMIRGRHFLGRALDRQGGPAWAEVWCGKCLYLPLGLIATVAQQLVDAPLEDLLSVPTTRR